MIAWLAVASAQVLPASFPAEDAPHEGTWLQWPHARTYGPLYRNRTEPTFVAMVAALAPHERVHVIAWDAAHQARITSRLSAAGVPMGAVDFLLAPTDDVWVRDDGPIFVKDATGRTVVEDWGFNGWGLDAPFQLDDEVPAAVAGQLGLPRADLDAIVLEGGAIEVDGAGTLMATRSSLLEPDRNPKLGEAQLEAVLTEALGVSAFLWLDGARGYGWDITDFHVDGFARFGPDGTLVTMADADLSYWGLGAADLAVLAGAADAAGVPYRRVDLPLTARDVVTTYGVPLGYKGSYTNYYVANGVVLVPTYADPNDAVAIAILQQLYPTRTVVGVDSRDLYRYGGMIHCVTQQQPL